MGGQWLASHFRINKIVTLKQRGHILDLGAVPNRSTTDTLEDVLYRDNAAEVNRVVDWCIFDGSEIGSTGMKMKWSYSAQARLTQEN